MKKLLYELLENDRSVVFYIYNTFSFTVIFISVILTIYDEIHDFHSSIHPIVKNIEYFASLIIAFELVGRYVIAENKLNYLKNPLTILDFIAIIPTFQSFRIIRLLVLIARVLRLTYRYNFFFAFFKNVLKDFAYELIFLLAIFFVFIFSLILIIFSIEHLGGNPNIRSLYDALYYVIITATTVGYGDITPKTPEGRFLAMVLGISGLFLFSLITATFSTSFFHYVNMLKAGMVSFREMKNHIVICGWNETGEVVLESLKKFYEEKGERMKPVVVITEQELEPRKEFYYKKGDYVSEEVLKNAGVENASVVIILAEKGVNLTEDSIDARTILSAMLVRDLNPRATIIAEILLRENAKTIKRKKIIDYIVVDGEVVGLMISNFLKKREKADVLDLIIEKVDYEEIPAGESKTVEELEREIKDGKILLGIRRGDEIIVMPDKDFEVLPEDMLIIVKKKTSI
ncbi:NAD-binding protein [Aquifex pyrophilus]